MTRSDRGMGLARPWDDPLRSAAEKGPAPPPRPLDWHVMLRLTNKERQISELIARGYSNKDIARFLPASIGASEDSVSRKRQMSPRTVATHVERIRTKLGVSSRIRIVVAMYSAGYREQCHAATDPLNVLNRQAS